MIYGNEREETTMDRKKERLIIEGNAFYEIDLECLEKKKKMQKENQILQQEKRQRK